MTGNFLVLDTNMSVRTVELDPDNLDEIYREIKCDCFDIARRHVGGVGGKYFDIFCDDEGLFCENPKVSAIDGDANVMLVGNLLFANHDGCGGTVGLTNEDISLILSNIILYSSSNMGCGIAVICEY